MFGIRSIKRSIQKSTPKPAQKTAVSAKKAAPASRTGTLKAALKKTEIIQRIADAVTLSRKEVGAVLSELENIIGQHMKKQGPQEFVLAGLLKIKTVNKKATKARKGVNPFTGETTMFKAKPARSVVKIKALKKLKEMVA
jgi:nucleoid DNA-binding protein